MSHYLKQTIAAETRKQLIVAVKFRRGPANDSPDFIWTLKKVLAAERPVKVVRADKGYDAESNHEYAQEVLGARTVIPVRAASRPKVKMRGKRRRKMAREWDDEEYHPRVKVETVFSVEKRVSGSHVLARDTSQQHKELVFKALAYNGRRMESLFLLFTEDFYTAPLCESRGKYLERACRRLDYAVVEVGADREPAHLRDEERCYEKIERGKDRKDGPGIADCPDSPEDGERRDGQ
jgi:hypothetical protein